MQSSPRAAADDRVEQQRDGDESEERRRAHEAHERQRAYVLASLLSVGRPNGGSGRAQRF